MGWKGASIGLGALVLAIGAIGGAGYVFRTSLAEAALGAALAGRSSDADLDVVRLDARGVRIENLKLGERGAPALSAAVVEVDFDPLALLSGRVAAVRAMDVTARITIAADGAITAPGLTLPSGPRSAEGQPGAYALPPISVTGGRLFIDTPAGRVTGSIDLSGDRETGWRILVAADPAQLRRGENSLVLETGALAATISGAGVEARGQLEVREVAGLGLGVEGVRLDAEFAGTVDDPATLLGLDGTGAVSWVVDGLALTPERALALVERGLPRFSGLADDLLGAHRGVLEDAFVSSLGDLDAEGAVQLRVADTRAFGAVLIGPLTLSSPTTGVELTVSETGAVAPDAASLEYRRDTGVLAASGLLAELGGGAVPRARVEIASMGRTPPSAAGGATIYGGGAFSVDRFVADGAAIELAAPRFDWTLAPVGLRIAGRLEAAVEGRRLGADLVGGRADLELVLIGRDGGLEVYAAPTSEQSITLERAEVGGVALAALRGLVGPTRVDDPLLATGPDGVRFAAQIADAAAAIGAAGWTIGAEAPSIELSAAAPPGADPTLSLRMQAPRFVGRDAEGDTLAADAGILEIGRAAEAPPGQLRIEVQGVNLAASSVPARLTKAAATADLTFAEGRPETGRLVLSAATVRDEQDAEARFAPMEVSGEGAIADGLLTGRLDVRLDGARTPVGAVAVEHGFATGVGVARWTSERLAFAPGAFQPADLAPITRGLVADVRGAVSSDGAASWGREVLRARGRLAIEELDFDTIIGRMEGLAGALEVADLAGLATDAPQRFTVRRFDPGVSFEGGSFGLELLGGGAVRVVEATAPFAGGTLRLDPLTFTPGEGERAGAVELENIDLRAVVGLFDPPDLDITGRASGRAPFLMSGPRILVEDGALETIVKGKIAYTGAAGDSAGEVDPSVALTFDALRNFEYDRLTVGLDGDLTGDMTLSVRAEGRNPDLLNGHPINLNVTTSAQFARLLSSAGRAFDVRGRVEEAQAQRLEAEAGDAAAPGAENQTAGAGGGQ